MIIKSFELKKNSHNINKNNFFLVYGENIGLKKDVKQFIVSELNQKGGDIEISSFYENEILDNEDVFFDSIYSGSLFSQKKIIIIIGTSDKILKKINDVFDKCPKDLFLIIISDILEKKSKLRDFFEKSEKAICIPCYLDNERDLEKIAHSELTKNNISLSRETINLLIEKSNFDRNNLRNEIEKIKSFSLNKKNIEFEDVQSLINFSGEFKSDLLVNECLSGNINQYKKIVSELYASTINQVLLLRILSNKTHRLLKIKEQHNKNVNIDSIINATKPTIFWKEKPIVKKQLSIWNFNELEKIIDDINYTELLCKKNPHISNSIFFNFFSGICKKASNFS